MASTDKKDLGSLIVRTDSSRLPVTGQRRRFSLEEAEQRYGAATRSRSEVRIIWALDKTGSMSGLIHEAKRASAAFFRKIAEQNVRVSVRWAPFGDYVDYATHGMPGLLEDHPFLDEPSELSDLIARTQLVSGGDADEAIEYLLASAVHTSDSCDAIVLIGDANPHPPTEALRQVREHRVPVQWDLDWRQSAAELGAKKLPVYTFPMHQTCHNSFADIARLSGGVTGSLDNLSSLLDLLTLATVSVSTGSAGVEDYVQRFRNTLGQEALAFASQLLLEDKKRGR